MTELGILLYIIVACIAFVPISRRLDTTTPEDDDFARTALVGSTAAFIAAFWVFAVAVVLIACVLVTLVKVTSGRSR